MKSKLDKNEKKKNNREYIRMARRNNHSNPKINWIKNESEKGRKKQRHTNGKNNTQGIRLNDMIASTLITQCQNFSATQSLNMINCPPLIQCSLFVDDFSALVLYFWIFRDLGSVAWDLGILVLIVLCVCVIICFILIQWHSYFSQPPIIMLELLCSFLNSVFAIYNPNHCP